MVVGWTGPAPPRRDRPRGQCRRRVDHWAPAHTEAGLADTLTRLARHGQPTSCRWRSSSPAGWSSTGWVAAGRPGVPVHASAFPAARPRWARRGPSPTWRQLQAGRRPTHRRPSTAAAAAAGGCPPRTPSPVRLGQDHLKAKVAASTSSAPCWTPTGPAPRRSCPGSARRSPWPSWPPTPQAAARLGEAAPGGLVPPPFRPRRP
jgi:hypothetical protein